MVFRSGYYLFCPPMGHRFRTPIAIKFYEYKKVLKETWVNSAAICGKGQPVDLQWVQIKVDSGYSVTNITKSQFQMLWSLWIGSKVNGG